jgi:formate hydrogenlyase transcriptional activator
MPAAEVLATGKPIVACAADVGRYPGTRRFLALGLKSICWLPWFTRDRVFGTLALSRMTDDEWNPGDVEFLVQVASQVAIAVENSLTYRELGQIKERLAIEKVYLEDEIRLEHNIGNMVGKGPAFRPF